MIFGYFTSVLSDLFHAEGEIEGGEYGNMHNVVRLKDDGMKFKFYKTKPKTLYRTSRGEKLVFRWVGQREIRPNIDTPRRRLASFGRPLFL